MNSIPQTILPLSPSSLPIYKYTRRHAGHGAHELESQNHAALGLAISQVADGTIDYLALATEDAVFLIELSSSLESQRYRVSEDAAAPVDRVLKDLLGSTKHVLAGFGMPRMVLRLHHHLHYHVRGVELSSLFSENKSWLPSKVIGRALLCNLDLVKSLRVDRLWHENDQDEARLEKLCLRAWISAKIATSASSTSLIEAARKIDTRHVRKDILLCLGTLLRQVDILAHAQPKSSQNEYDSFAFNLNGGANLLNARYKNRVRVSKQAYVEATTSDGAVIRGRAIRTQGRTTEIKFDQHFTQSKDLTIHVVGLDNPSASEQAREHLLRRTLQDIDKLQHAGFIRFLWFPTKQDIEALNQKSAADLYHLKRYTDHLNDSQATVVGAMVSTASDPVVVVHGPPGTGKTTTISSAAEIWSQDTEHPVWIIGHSNVSVKNIAEKLFKRKVDFKLIVSKEFYVEWHEHIYKAIEERLIRSDELPSDRVALERVIGGSRVILSTLGLLSNPGFDKNGMFDTVPVERLVIDEASQINVFEYMHVFHKHRKTLIKVCFFGDPKQLPPFGKEKAKKLQSVFEIIRLQENSYFLNVQYRMPILLGNFISTQVYGGRLQSEHLNKSLSCLRFVDTRGQEEKNGFSWANTSEIHSVVHLVKYYYRHTNFCIITPYDAQRAAIQRTLKSERLPWEAVYNVDSFQGNEADYVIISVVRTNHVGFLSSMQRMNVMLTRCRQGMVIVSSRLFLETKARDTLLGKLSRWLLEYTARNGYQFEHWVSATEVMNQRVHLPGALGRTPSTTDPNSLIVDGMSQGATFSERKATSSWHSEKPTNFRGPTHSQNHFPVLESIIHAGFTRRAPPCQSSVSNTGSTARSLAYRYKMPAAALTQNGSAARPSSNTWLTGDVQSTQHGSGHASQREVYPRTDLPETVWPKLPSPGVDPQVQAFRRELTQNQSRNKKQARKDKGKAKPIGPVTLRIVSSKVVGTSRKN